jgi:hypothetical protein
MNPLWDTWNGITMPNGAGIVESNNDCAGYVFAGFGKNTIRMHRAWAILKQWLKRVRGQR